MSDYQADYGVFIGRLQCPHRGHHRVIEIALEKVEKLIILLGSANSPRTLRNPWTWQERAAMIRAAFPGLEDRIIIKPLEDMTYRNVEWLKQVQDIVDDTVAEDHPQWSDKPPRIALIGSQKDASGYYLSLFPQWDSIPVDHKLPLNATEIREALFGDGDKLVKDIADWVHPAVMKVVEQDLGKQWVFDLQSEHAWIAKNNKDCGYDKLKWPPIFQTADAVVVASGQVLLIERKAKPGKGMLALPGGYVNQHETVEDAIYRELLEETKIDISMTRLKAAMKTMKRFDDPRRSDRGRIITEAALFVLPNEKKLPKVKGGDDAAKAFWVPINQINPMKMFEDHAHIIATLLASA